MANFEDIDNVEERLANVQNKITVTRNLNESILFFVNIEEKCIVEQKMISAAFITVFILEM